MLASRLGQIRRSLSTDSTSEWDAESFLERHFFPRWLPLLVGAILGIAAAILITNGLFPYLIPLVFLVPAICLLTRYPFAAIILWLLLFPYVAQDATSAGRPVYWLLHRAMIPGTLMLVILADWLKIRKREPVRFGRAELAMGLFMMLAIANILLLSQELIPSLIRYYDRLFVPFCMYWLIRLIAPTEQDLRRLVWAALITVIIQV